MLRPATQADLGALIELARQPEIARTLAWDAADDARRGARGRLRRAAGGRGSTARSPVASAGRSPTAARGSSRSAR